MRRWHLFIAIICLGWNFSLSGLPAQVMIIRHAEKPSGGDSLSIKGKERAAALAPYFTETAEFLTYGPPVDIYAMASSKEDSSQRPIETVQPLADALKLTIKNSYVINDYKKMVADIKANSLYTGKNVLICWEHKEIPEIARAFGALQTPARWQSEVFDRVWLITFGPTGRASFQNLPQKLMYGDSSI